MPLWQGPDPLPGDQIHIALCTDGVFPHAMGGMQRHSRLLAEHLSSLPGVRLSVIHPHAEGIFDPSKGIQEVTVQPIDTGAFYLRELWSYSGRVAEELDRLKPDVIISQGFSVWKDIERYTPKLIVHPHGLEMFQAIGRKERSIAIPFKMVLRWIMRRAAVVISLGGMITTILKQQVAGSKARVVTIPNAVDVPAEPAPYPADEKPLRLLFVGRFAFNKGIDLLIEAARRLEREGLKDAVLFQIAGEGPLLEHYRSQGLPANVLLTGRLDDAGLIRHYKECHALILPTRFEGMPTVVLEAMAHARPILVSDVGATAELVDGSNGWLLPKGDVDALVAAIKDFVQVKDQAQRKAMGLRGHQRALQGHQWPVVAGSFLELARKVV
jgi:glycosyltransferase involved in cell wall biosynthesis